MKKKLLLFFLPFIFCLGACSATSGGSNSNKDLCTKALDSFPILLNFSTGKEIFATSNAIEAEDYTSYLALNSLTWKEKEFDLTWSCSPQEKWSVNAYSSDTSRTKYMPLYGKEEYEASLSLTINVKGDEKNSVTQTWNFKVDTHESPDLSDYTYISLKDLEEQYNADNNSHSGDKIYTFGKIVATMEPNETHLYSGAYIQDGEYGLMLYAGQLSTLWFSVGFEIGDVVMIAGPTSPYSGLLEVKPTYIEYADSYLLEKDITVSEPITNDLTNIAWSANTVNIYQNTLIKLDGLRYAGVKTALKVGTHGGLLFKDKNGVEILAYVNYHIGENSYNSLIDLTSTWVVNETKVNFYGLLSVYNDPQIFPVYGANSFTVVS